jgi:hypothetical protein
MDAAVGATASTSFSGRSSVIGDAIRLSTSHVSKSLADESCMIPDESIHLATRMLTKVDAFFRTVTPRRPKPIFLKLHQLAGAATFFLRFILKDILVNKVSSIMYTEGCGEGKTYTIIAYICILKAYHSSCVLCKNGSNCDSCKSFSCPSPIKVLLIVPPAVVQMWQSRVSQFDLSKYQMRGRNKISDNCIMHCNVLIYSSNILSINANGTMNNDNIVDFKPTIMIYDESQGIKNIKSNVTRSCIAIRQHPDVHIQQCILSTATPIMNDMSDLAAQLYAAGIITKNTDYNTISDDWATNYFVKYAERTQPDYSTQYVNLDVSVQDSIMTDIKKTETSKGNHFSKLSAVAKKLVKDQVQAIVKIIMDDRKETIAKGAPKNNFVVFFYYLSFIKPMQKALDALSSDALRKLNEESFIEDLNEKKLNEDFSKLNVRTISGETKKDEKDDIVSNCHSLDVLIASARCAGVGLNLQAMNRAIFVWPPNNVPTEIQAIARINRTGQTRDTVHYFIRCSTSTEDRMIEISSNKIQHMKIADPIRSDDKYISTRYNMALAPAPAPARNDNDHDDNLPTPARNDNDHDDNLPTPAQTREEDNDDSEIGGSDSDSRKRKRPQPPCIQRAVRSILRKVGNDRMLLRSSKRQDEPLDANLSETAKARKKAFLDSLAKEGFLVEEAKVPVRRKVSSDKKLLQDEKDRKQQAFLDALLKEMAVEQT